MTDSHTWKTGALSALRSFGLEKFAGLLDSIDHAIARGTIRLNESPHRAAGLIKAIQAQIAQQALGKGSVHAPFYGEGKLPAHLFKRDPTKPGLQPPSVKGHVAFQADPGRGIKPNTVLGPGMQPHGIELPTGIIKMPTEGLGAFPPSSLPRYSDALKNPEEHLELLRHLHKQAPVDYTDLARHPALAEIARRYDLSRRV